MVSHWDDAQGQCYAWEPLMGEVSDLGEAAGSVEVGLTRWRPCPENQTTPAHCEGGEEEITFVLAGSGWSWQDGVTYAVSAGDVLVHRIDEATHTLVGGDGLDVLAFGPRATSGSTTLPRAGVLRVQETWVALAGDPHPYTREAAAGRVALSDPQPRPDTIVALADVQPRAWGRGRVDVLRRDLGRAAGSVRTGLQHIEVAPGARSAPLHCHSAEEELFVVLDGSGVVLLGDEEHPVRRGSVVSRPAGTGVAHAFEAGPEGVALLAYGTREPSDMCWYPDSEKISFRGVKVIARVQRLDYWDGEEQVP